MAKQKPRGKKFVVEVEQIEQVTYVQNIVIYADSAEAAREKVKGFIAEDLIADEAYHERDSASLAPYIRAVREG